MVTYIVASKARSSFLAEVRTMMVFIKLRCKPWVNSWRRTVQV